MEISDLGLASVLDFPVMTALLVYKWYLICKFVYFLNMS